MIKQIKMMVIDLLKSNRIFYLCLGFIMGAIVPIYYILIKNYGLPLGDLGEWIGSIATLAAVIVSLYISSKSSKSTIKIIPNNDVPNKDIQEMEILNSGEGTDSVRMFLLWKVSDFRGPSKSRETDFNGFETLGNGIANYLTCFNEYGDKVKYDYYKRYEIKGKLSIQLRISQQQILNYLSEKSSKIKSGDRSVDLIVRIQNADNKIINKKLQITDSITISTVKRPVEHN